MVDEKKHKAILALSWLANVNERLIGTDAQLQRHAVTRIQKSLGDPQMSAFGVPLWGPVTANRRLDLHSPWNCFTHHLAYVVQGKNLFDLDYLFVIGVAGALLASSGSESPLLTGGFTIPWNAEDVGHISADAATGLAILLSMKDSLEGYLMDFLKLALLHLPNANVEIAVAGHRLGGTIATILALKLKETLEQIEESPHVIVSAWPTEGPIPGDSAFSSYLVETLSPENYCSFSNAPHLMLLPQYDSFLDKQRTASFKASVPLLVNK